MWHKNAAFIFAKSQLIYESHIQKKLRKEKEKVENVA